MDKVGFYMKGGIVPMLSKSDWRLNKKCCLILISTTVVFLLTAISIGCYYAASRDSNQYGNYKDFDVVSVTDSSLLGKFSHSKFGTSQRDFIKNVPFRATR